MYKPKWSKAKKHLKSFICEPLRSRVDFQIINYRKAHDQLGRVVITIDKVEKWSMCTSTAQIEEYRRERDLEKELNDFNADDIAKSTFIAEQVHKLQYLHSKKGYLRMMFLHINKKTCLLQHVCDQSLNQDL